RAVAVHTGQQDLTGTIGLHPLRPLNGVNSSWGATPVDVDLPAYRSFWFLVSGFWLPAFRVYGYDDALGSESLCRLSHKLGSVHCCGVDRHFVRSGIEQIANILNFS